MEPEITQKTLRSTLLEYEPKSLDLCKLELKKKGLSDDKIELLEKNIRAIINITFDDLEDD
jgi:hypothetical protein